MTEDFSQVFDALGEQTRRAAAGGTSAPLLPQEEVSGSSGDGEVTVRLVGGRATGCDIDVRAMRLTNAELAEHVVAAVNAAVDAHTAAVAAAMQDQRTDFGMLREQLANIGAEAQRSMERYAAGMHESLARANQAAAAAAARRTGDADV